MLYSLQQFPRLWAQHLFWPQLKPCPSQGLLSAGNEELLQEQLGWPQFNAFRFKAAFTFDV